MSRRRTFSLCALPALSAVLLASSSETPAGPGGTSVKEEASERGVPALFSWADCDGDGRLDIAAVSADGTLRLLQSVGEGRFEDVTERVGLGGVGNAALASWADYDADGRLDLFVGARAGASRLFHNEGGVFVDMSAASGLASTGAVQSAQWFDHDGDGRPDLHVVTSETHELYRGLAGGFFERAELPLAGAGSLAGPSVVIGEPAGETSSAPGTSSDEPGSDESGSTRGAVGRVVPSGTRVSPGLPSSGGGSAPLLIFPANCAASVKDQANPGTCLLASTTPTLGRLYPLSTNLFVAVGGDVGIGTTAPGAKLEVAGTARITDTLTLNPSGDQALDVNTGSIYKGGLLFMHTKGAGGNTALGHDALSSVTSGFDNTATGDAALFSNTTGTDNTASGSDALRDNTTGFQNTASSADALVFNTTGFQNTASGFAALRSNTTGSLNTASGVYALISNTTGAENTATGHRALYSNTTAIRNTANGHLALNSNTTGYENTATGNRALEFSTTGIKNTASGAFALRSNTTGDDNTASGLRALHSNTTGRENTASGSQALSSNTTGIFNTATGSEALYSNTTGDRNTANGTRALFNNTTGEGNTASGMFTLEANTIGDGNTASGRSAMRSNVLGSSNTAIGYWALGFGASGSYNTAIGDDALSSNTGHRNIALGSGAGQSLTTANDNIAIGNSGVAGEGATIRIGTAGTHTKTFMAGIRTATTDIANAIPVRIDSSGQLGTASSSRRFKKDIADMGDASDRLLELRPVVFHYKQEQTLPNGGEVPFEYGLIAEEVAEILPDLVVYDEDGLAFTVKYDLLSSMLLNELKKLNSAHVMQLDELRAELEEQRNEFEARLAGLEARAVLAPLPTAGTR